MMFQQRPDPELIRDPKRALIDMAIVLVLIAIAVGVLLFLVHMAGNGPNVSGVLGPPGTVTHLVSPTP
jgi:hypothetical protein